MAEFQFVDAHVHFYDMHHPDLFYGDWQPGIAHPFLGMQIQKLAERNYLAEDYIAETRNAKVIKAIHVQAAIGTKDPVKETEWLQASADRTGYPHGIIAHANLKDPRAESVLERHCQYPRMRGIRDFSYGDYLVEPEFHLGFALLEKYNLVSSVSVQWQDMEKLRGLASKFPNTYIVIDHAGFPTERTSEYFANWRQGMATAAASENVLCKISGLGMADNDWTMDSIRPYVFHCIETFGVDRCLFATNWPIDSIWSTYDVLVGSYNELLSGFSDNEHKAMFSANAERLYRI